MTTTNETTANTIKCCFCGTEERYGNNPAPFEVEKGERCCDDCNRDLVVAARVRAASYKGNDKVIGAVSVKDQKTGELERMFYYTYGNLEGEENTDCLCGGNDSDSEPDCEVEAIDDLGEFFERKQRDNVKKEEKLKSLLKYLKSRHTFQGMNVMDNDGEIKYGEAPSWFKKIGAEGTNYYKMLSKDYPSFHLKFGDWMMPVFYLINYIHEEPFKINGEFGDWSIGEFGSVWMDLRMKVPLVDGTTKKCVFRVAFYHTHPHPLSICEFHESTHSAECVNADMTSLRLRPSPRNSDEDLTMVRQAEERAQMLLRQQEKLFRDEEKAKKQREFEEEQREKERAWRARVEADRIVAETENIRKQTELMEQNRQIIAQKEKERLAEAKAEKERKAKEAAEKAAAKKAEKAAADAAKFGNKKK
jgi:hypothetical protein